MMHMMQIQVQCLVLLLQVALMFSDGPDALSAETRRVHAGQTAVVRHELQPIIWLIISCYVPVVKSVAFIIKHKGKWA